MSSGPTKRELLTIDEELAMDEMRAQLPVEPKRGFDMGRGHSDSPPEPTYGRQRIVGRIRTRDHAGRPVTRSMFADWLAVRGIKHEHVFETSRYWCAVVFE